MLSGKQLQELRQATFATQPKEQLIEIETVSMDPKLPKIQRAERYLEQIKNPYLFRCGEIGVKLEFAGPENPSLQQILVSFLARKR